MVLPLEFEPMCMVLLVTGDGILTRVGITHRSRQNHTMLWSSLLAYGLALTGDTRAISRLDMIFAG